MKVYEVVLYAHGDDAPYFRFLCDDEATLARIRDKVNDANLFLRGGTLSPASLVEKWLDAQLS